MCRNFFRRSHVPQIRSWPFFVAILAALISIAATDRAAASPREDLAAHGLEFTADAFLERAGAGDLEVVKLFLAAGMDVNAKGGRMRKKFTALYEATLKGRAKVVQFLIEKKVKTSKAISK